MKFKTRRSKFKSQRGMATIETLSLSVIFLLLAGYCIGFFGAIHTGILQSIAARNYAFETFRHRANLTYFRDNDTQSFRVYYRASEMRFHAVVAANSQDDLFYAEEREISIALKPDEQGRTERVHNQELQNIAAGERYSGEGVNPIWLRIQYGICMNASCGEGG